MGDDGFVNNMQCKIDPEQSLKDIPKKQKQAPVKPLAYFAERHKSRNESIAYAYLSGHYTLTQVGDYFDMSYATKDQHERSRSARSARSGAGL